MRGTMVRSLRSCRLPQVLLVALLLSVNEAQLLGSAKSVRLTQAHLRIIPQATPSIDEISRNATGHITEIRGIFPEAMEWLSQYYHFSYSYLQQIAIRQNDDKLVRGTMSYLILGEADVVLITTALSTYSNQVDFTMPLLVDSVCFLIPYPEASFSATKIMNPFEFVVWLCILLSFPMVIFALWGIVRLHSKVTNNATDFSLRRAFHYAFCVILSQGDEILTRNTTVRLAAGAWCLACFVLVTAYNSVLTSCILAPEVHPIIDSIHDLVGNSHSNVRLLVEKASIYELTYKIAKEGSFRKIGDILRSNPDLLCPNKTECMAQVISGKNERAFVEIGVVLNALMTKDFKETGKCRFTLAKQPSNYPKLGHALSKNSPYTEHFDKGIMLMWQHGLINKWFDMYAPKPSQCVKTDQQIHGKSQLSLKNLSGAFAVLLIGYASSILTFAVERIVHSCQRRRHHHG